MSEARGKAVVINGKPAELATFKSRAKHNKAQNVPQVWFKKSVAQAVCYNTVTLCPSLGCHIYATRCAPQFEPMSQIVPKRPALLFNKYVINNKVKQNRTFYINS
jgi:hypothetical protein